MVTKHNLIINFIEALPVGERISVRGVAKELNVSEGTAYRAIKDAELMGLVTTIERVGTIRIEKKSVALPDLLTYEEIIELIDGTVIGGQEGLDRSLKRFIIGAMTKESMVSYFGDDTCMIVGNREGVHRLALHHHLAVIVTGGFDISDDIIDLANEYRLPLISTPYDTFCVATMLNRSLLEREQRNDLITVGDVFIDKSQCPTLTPVDTLANYQQLVEESGINNIPVVHHGRLVGVISHLDVRGRAENTQIERMMNKEYSHVRTHTSVVNVIQQMNDKDVNALAVVDESLNFIGLVTRNNVNTALQYFNQQLKLGSYFDDKIIHHIQPVSAKHRLNDYDYAVEIQMSMLNKLGTVSIGTLAEMIGYVANQYLLEHNGQNTILDLFNYYSFELIQLGNLVYFKVDVINQSYKNVYLEVGVFQNNKLVGKASLEMHFIDQG